MNDKERAFSGGSWVEAHSLVAVNVLPQFMSFGVGYLTHSPSRKGRASEIVREFLLMEGPDESQLIVHSSRNEGVYVGAVRTTSESFGTNYPDRAGIIDQGNELDSNRLL